MKQLPWRDWTVQYVLPAVVLLGSLAIMFLFSDDPDMVWIFLIAPAIALLTGFVAQPELAWVTPLAVSLLLAASIVVAALLDLVDPEGQLPVVAVITVLTVSLPLTFFTWLGTALGMVYRDRRENQRWEAEWRNGHPTNTADP